MMVLKLLSTDRHSHVENIFNRIYRGDDENLPTRGQTWWGFSPQWSNQPVQNSIHILGIPGCFSLSISSMCAPSFISWKLAVINATNNHQWENFLTMNWELASYLKAGFRWWGVTMYPGKQLTTTIQFLNSGTLGLSLSVQTLSLWKISKRTTNKCIIFHNATGLIKLMAFLHNL